jgi:hypothetical protein
MGIQISEVSKFTSNPNKEIIRYLNYLIDKKCILRLSLEPLLYEFTEIGKKIKTDSDINKLIKNVA